MIPSSHELHDVSMRRQQTLRLLELSWREHKQIFSHMMYGVAGVEEGTLIVKRGYPLAWNDQEAFPSWKMFHICSSITRGVFDKEHVKGKTLAWARAFLHELTTLSLGSRITHMDPSIILLLAYGKSLVFSFSDFHTLIIMLQCMAPQRGKFFMFLHEKIWAKPYDGDSHLTHGLGKKIFHSTHAQIIHMISLVFQNILPCPFLKQWFLKLRCIHLGDCWYLQAP